ncbi:hypothetical protein [Ornithinimicrobium murale]|uniref:hypothetical protein n=1 Tax=Ornithinimicrobium murale TaxID=1050153 RepID=UPI000E0CCD0F|nr:hypothetical protein [Ornithinimicrobium murale]
MEILSEVPGLKAGEHFVVEHEAGEGDTYRLTVLGPDGRSSEQTVLWTWSKTAQQVAEEAVAGHLGRPGDARPTAPTRGTGGSYVVTMV